MTEYCICGHTEGIHIGMSGYCDKYIGNAGLANDIFCSCPHFKLDNLKYIEDLAKEKNLI